MKSPVKRSIRSVLHVGISLLFGGENETVEQKLDRLSELKRQKDLLEKPFREQIAALEKDLQDESADVQAAIESLETEIARALAI